MNMQVTVSMLWVLFAATLSVSARYHDGSIGQSLDEAHSRQARNTYQFTTQQRQFQQAALDTHNILRAKHCSPPLVLDDEINVRAQTYANVLAANDNGLVHSTDRNGLFGENLYSLWSTSEITNPNADKAVRTLYSEVAYYDFSNPGYSTNIAHFSQIVWKDSRKLGVGYALARQNKKIYVVAQYGPPGNYGWSFRENVLPTTCVTAD